MEFRSVSKAEIVVYVPLTRTLPIQTAGRRAEALLGLVI